MTRRDHVIAWGLGWFVFLGALGPSAVAQERSDEKYNFIAGLFDRGFHEMVVEEARTFLEEYERHPRAALVRYRLGQSLFELKRFQESRDALLPLERLRGGFPYRGEIEFRLGQCALELGADKEAARRFEKLLESEPAEYLAHPAAYYAGEAQFRVGNYEDAARAYARVLQAEGVDPELMRGSVYGLAWALFRAGQPEDAGKTFEAYLQRYPRDGAVAEARFLFGECLSQQGRHEEALVQYLEVGEGEYRDDSLSAAGFACAELEDHERAARYFLRLETAEPASPLVPEARLHAGIHSYQAGDLRTAGAVLDRLLASEEGRESAEACYWRGQVERQTEGPAAAAQWFERGLDHAPEGELRDRLVLARSDSLFDAGRFDEAASGYEAVSGRSDDALFSAAVSALNADRPEEAITRGRQLLETFPRSRYRLDALLVVGEGHFAREEYEQALAAFEQIVELSGPEGTDGDGFLERPRALSRRAWCLFQLGRFDEAASAFAQLEREFPEDDRSVEASFMVGRSSLRAGRHDTAEEQLTEHLRRHSSSPFAADARYDLAQTLRLLGRPEAAANLLGGLVTAGDGADPALVLRAKFDRAELLAAAGEHEEAAALLAEVVAGTSDPQLLRPALYALAWSSFELGRWQPARGALEQLLSDRTLPPALAVPALELGASVSRAEGNAAGAVGAYQRLRKLDAEHPRTPEVALVAGIALKESGSPEDALVLLADAERTWPDFEGLDRIQYERAFLERDLGRANDYAATLERLLAGFPNSPLAPEAAFFRAEELFAAERYDEAQAFYAKAGGEGARVADLALYKSAWCHFRRDRLLDAAQEFRQLHQRFPDSVVAGESLFLAGEALYRAEHYDRAGELLDEFVAGYPEHESFPRGLFRLGLCHGELRRYEECLPRLLTLLDRWPDFEHRLEAELWIGRGFLAQERLTEARRRFQTVVDEDRSVLASRALLGLGRCSLAEQRYDDALGSFLKVALLYDAPTEVSEALWFSGQCLESKQDPARAADRYRELLEKYPESPRAEEARRRLRELQGL